MTTFHRYQTYRTRGNGRIRKALVVATLVLIFATTAAAAFLTGKAQGAEMCDRVFFYSATQEVMGDTALLNIGKD